MALVSEQTKRKIHIRNTDFFLKNYRDVTVDIDKSILKQIVDIELQCLGYGVFNPDVLLDKFVTYTVQMLRYIAPTSNIRSLKIVLNGFTLNPAKAPLRKIAGQIARIKDNLNVLWFHTANLRNVTLQDFNELLKVLIQLSNINFQDYSLQCATWKFIPTQPTYKDLSRIFNQIIKDMDFAKIQNKHFRLQMSGWFNTIADAKAFLGFRLDPRELGAGEEGVRGEVQEYSQDAFEKELEKFFVEMVNLISRLLDIMDNVEEFQLDMRHTHDILKFKNLKKRLNNISKQNRYEMSIMSKKMDVQMEQGQKQLKLNIVM